MFIVKSGKIWFKRQSRRIHCSGRKHDAARNRWGFVPEEGSCLTCTPLKMEKPVVWCYRHPGSIPSPGGVWRFFCAEFGCCPCVCMSSLRVLQLNPSVHTHTRAWRMAELATLNWPEVWVVVLGYYRLQPPCWAFVGEAVDGWMDEVHPL